MSDEKKKSPFPIKKIETGRNEENPEKSVDDVESVAETDLQEKEKREQIEEEFQEVEEVSGETRATVSPVKKCPHCGGNLTKMKQPNIFDADYMCETCDIGYRDD